ncbi:MAG: hypothetical protein K6G88_08795 [Lachnospiraceae bacterium]|nr:hypothetical protein [Lachnospiraceae bacterium]
MTNGDYIRGLIIRKINNLSYEGLLNYVFDVEDVEGDYPILTMSQDAFEKEVYPNMSEKELEELLSSGKYFDEMHKWLKREMK